MDSRVLDGSNRSDCSRRFGEMALTREKELWAIAVQIEKEHGENGGSFIAARIGQYALAGEGRAVELWKQIAEKFAALQGLDGVRKDFPTRSDM